MPVQLVTPKRFGDARGWFAETYSRDRYAALGIPGPFVQDNHSMSATVGTLRGLHWQAPPHAQGKLVRCVRGRVWDVAVDVRRGSPTFGQWVGAELSAANGTQIWVPVGFAHGFVTLEPDSEIEYKVTAGYAPAAEGGLRWDDPDLALPWPLPPGGPMLADKDRALPFLSEIETPFDYDGVPLTPLDAQ